LAITGLQHFNLRIPESELNEVQAFYVEVLGLRPGPRPSFRSRGAWLYAGDRPLIHLTQMNSGHSALDHIALACDDLAAMRERLERRHVAYQVTEVPTAGEVQLFLRDPCGTGIELIFPLR
jgi:extradiol dioxygenase family protein